MYKGVVLIKLLIYIGLLIPFIIFPKYDTREPKMIFALVIALLVSLLSIFRGKFRKFNNCWLFIFLGYIVISLSLIPHIYTVDEYLVIPDIWKPIFNVTVFSLFIVSVASIKFTKKELLNLTNFIINLSVIISIYTILQYLGIEQFFSIDGSPFPQAFMGNPGVNGTFLAMIVPLAFFIDYKKGIFIAIAIVLTNSQVAIGAMLISLIVVSVIKKRYYWIALILAALGVGFFKFNDNGRIQEWIKIIKLILKRPYTGYGMGAFQDIYTKISPEWLQAHNDYIEILFNTGIIGFLILGMFIFNVIRGHHRSINKYYIGSLIALLVAALGWFPFQLGAHIYYGCFIIGILMGGKNEIT